MPPQAAASSLWWRQDRSTFTLEPFGLHVRAVALTYGCSGVLRLRGKFRFLPKKPARPARAGGAIAFDLDPAADDDARMSIPTLGGGHGRHAVEATRAAVFRAAWGRLAARVGVVAFGVLGVVVLSMRAGGIEAVRPEWVGVAAGVVAVAVLAGTAVFAWKKRPAAEVIRALLDRRQKLGGLLMADAADGAAGRWAGRLAGVQPVAVRWRGGPTLGLLAGAAAFAVAATLVPIPEAAAGPGR